jgi:GTP cyclohydrolase II
MSELDDARGAKAGIKVDGKIMKDYRRGRRHQGRGRAGRGICPASRSAFGRARERLRRTLFEQTGGMYPELVTRPGPLGVPAADRRHHALYLRRSVRRVGQRRTLACRVHDECNGSDVFGSDICTCRPYPHPRHRGGISEAQNGGAGLIVYNRKEGRALGEVTKFSSTTRASVRRAATRPRPTSSAPNASPGVQDARFQQLMPDVLHWLGVTRIDASCRCRT